MADRPLTPAAVAVLVQMRAEPDTVRAMPRDVARELARAGLLCWVDGAPELTCRGMNRAEMESAR